MDLVLFLVGLIIGSFLNVVVVRINEEDGDVFRGILLGRSRCPKCRKQLKWYDNIPLLSFLLLGGKCRNCKKNISWQYPIVELLSGLIWVGTALLDYSGVNYLVWVVIFSLLLALFASDTRYMTLPEVFSAPLLCLVIVNIVWGNWGNWIVMGQYLLTALLACGFFAFIWWITRGNGMGFGDVEYVFIMGLMLGPIKTIVGLMIAFLSGAVIGVILILLKKSKLKGIIPFGPFLIAGTVVALFGGEGIANWYLGFL